MPYAFIKVANERLLYTEWANLVSIPHRDSLPTLRCLHRAYYQGWIFNHSTRGNIARLFLSGRIKIPPLLPIYLYIF